MDHLEQYRRCYNLAEAAHNGQHRSNGAPYFNHCLRVAAHVASNPTSRCIALLHDVIEDTQFTDIDMLNAGIDIDIVNGVRILTRRENETYNAYIKRICGHKSHLDLITIKLADLADNLSNLTSQTLLKRYTRAQAILCS